MWRQSSIRALAGLFTLALICLSIQLIYYTARYLLVKSDRFSCVSQHNNTVTMTVYRGFSQHKIKAVLLANLRGKMKLFWWQSFGKIQTLNHDMSGWAPTLTLKTRVEWLNNTLYICLFMYLRSRYRNL